MNPKPQTQSDHTHQTHGLPLLDGPSEDGSSETDPVCGMKVNPATANASFVHEERAAFRRVT